MPPRQLTAQNEFEFLLGFVEQDLSNVSGDGWKQLADGLCKFLAAGGVSIVEDPQQLPPDYPKRTMVALQREVGALLRGAISTRDRRVAYRGKHPGAILATTPRTLSFRATYVLNQVGDRSFLMVDGTLRTMFLVTVFHLFASESIQHLRVCECGRLFYRVRRQKHCKDAECRKARKKADWQRYIKSPPGQAARRAQYEPHGWKLGARSKKGARKR